ncbi:MAG: hypothetical protein LQ338_001493 [Usnochroma carphineum]|nr:MAG: hypothetical protein LQ338_001493 [Usnochroma carphineum]
MDSAMISAVIKYASLSAALLVALYASLLGLLTTPFFQAQVVYLHKLQMTWFKDLNVPESFGFLRNQVTPFTIRSADGGDLYAWHIVPLELYRQHESELTAEPSGFACDVTSRVSFNLLRDDPEARLIIHMHGAAGTVGSGYRVPNYRALSAGQPEKIHVLTFDYRGFGYSLGNPSEEGLKLDAISVVEWAINTAGIPPSQILVFGQSIGTAVSLAVSEHYAMQSPPIVFAGTIMVAPFADVATLVATYSIAGTIPILSPLARFSRVFGYLRTFIRDTWLSKDRIARYVQTNEANEKKYRLTLIHAEDDWDIPWHHTETLFWHAVNATSTQGVSYEQVQQFKKESKTDLGAAGSVTEWRTRNGVIREEILKTGLHDVIMGNPVISMAVMRMLAAADPSWR